VRRYFSSAELQSKTGVSLATPVPRGSESSRNANQLAMVKKIALNSAYSRGPAYDQPTGLLSELELIWWGDPT